MGTLDRTMLYEKSEEITSLDANDLARCNYVAIYDLGSF